MNSSQTQKQMRESFEDVDYPRADEARERKTRGDTRRERSLARFIKQVNARP